MAEKHPKRITITLEEDDWKAIIARVSEAAKIGRLVTPQDVLRESVRNAAWRKV
jgi:hypothetical protein